MADLWVKFDEEAKSDKDTKSDKNANSDKRLPDDFRHQLKCICGEWSPDSRNLVVCIDGTSNHFCAKNTNVVELYSRVIKESKSASNQKSGDSNEKSDVEQLAYYRSGIGADVPAARFPSLKRRFSNALDLAVARNISRTIQDSYRWLMDQYRPGDRLFFFGFSRGAHQVRTLAAMIERVGLLYPGDTGNIPFAYYNYREGDPEMTATFKETFSRKNVRVHFLGAWDTVSSVGFVRGKSLPLVNSCDHICFFRHALALDERRVKFIPEHVNPPSTPAHVSTGSGLHMATLGPGDGNQNEEGAAQQKHTFIEAPQSSGLWEKADATEGQGDKGISSTEWLLAQKSSRSLAHLKEVWFAGSHSDIGGGNSDNRALDLESVPLLWMEHEATLAGLELKTRDWVKQESNWQRLRQDKLTNSLTGVWRVLECFPIHYWSHPAGKVIWWFHYGRGRDITNGQLIHASLAFRAEEYKPKASLSFTGFDWKDLIGKGEIEDLSWAKGWENLLEMDVFDTKSTVDRVLAVLKAKNTELSHLRSNLTHLYFLARSADGAASIQSGDTIKMLADFLESDDTVVQYNSANCLAQLTKFARKSDPFGASRYSAAALPAISQLGQMLTSMDSVVVLSGMHCLTQLWDLEFFQMHGNLKDAIREVFTSSDQVLAQNILRTVSEELSNLLVPGGRGGKHHIPPQHLLCLSRLIDDDEIRSRLLSITGEAQVMTVVRRLMEIMSRQIEPATPGKTALHRLERFFAYRNDNHRVVSTSRMPNQLIADSLREWLRHENVINQLQTDPAIQSISVAIIKWLAERLKSKDDQVFGEGAEYLVVFVYDEDSAASVVNTDAVKTLMAAGITPASARWDKSLSCLYSLLQNGRKSLRDQIVEAGIIERFAEMLKSEDDDMFGTGAVYLCKLVSDERSSARLIKTDAVTTLIAALKTPGSTRQAESLLYLLRLFQCGQKGLRNHIVEAGIFEGVTDMLKSKDDEVFKAGVEYLYAFISDETSATRVEQSGAVKTLVAALKTPESARRDQSLLCLHYICQRAQKNLRGHIVGAGIIEQVAEMLKSTDNKDFQAGAQCLQDFIYDEECAARIEKSGALRSLIATLKHPDSARLPVAMLLITQLVTSYALIGRAILQNDSNVCLKLAAMMIKGEMTICFLATQALAALAAYDVPQDQLASVVIALLQHTDAPSQFNPASPALWTEFGKHANLRQAMLKENIMLKFLYLIQKNSALGIRECCSVTFCDLLRHDDLRSNALRAGVGSVQILTNLLESDDKPVHTNSLPQIWNLMDSLSGYASVVNAAATALRGFGPYEDAMDDILEAGSIKAMASLLSTGGSDRWDLQYSGAIFLAGCAKHARGRSVILQVNTIRALGGLCSVNRDDSKYGIVKGAAKEALEELAKHDETKAEAMQELGNLSATVHS